MAFRKRRKESQKARALQFEEFEQRRMMAADLERSALVTVGQQYLGQPTPTNSQSAPDNLRIDLIPQEYYTDFLPKNPSWGGWNQYLEYEFMFPPELESLPGAQEMIYLDFTGHYDMIWGSFVGAYSAPYNYNDDDVFTYSDEEYEAMYQIWAQVAEDYAPFNINVTTIAPLLRPLIPPPPPPEGEAPPPEPDYYEGNWTRVAIGGSDRWMGMYPASGGVAYLNTYGPGWFSTTAYVFSDNLAGGTPKFVAEAASHEAAHTLGLEHQSLWIDANSYYEYNPGNALVAPIMGNSYRAERGLWQAGPTPYSPYYAQDDMSMIASVVGYREDEAGGTTATALAVSSFGGEIEEYGIVSHMTDRDYFKFTTTGGVAYLELLVPEGINNLDARLELRDAAGNLVKMSAPTDSFGASMITTLSAGTYYAVVASEGNYGDVGQYLLYGQINGTSGLVDPDPPAPAAPTNLALTPGVGLSVLLNWKDNSGLETGFRVERQTSDNPQWTTIATLNPNTISYTDTNLTNGMSVNYRVVAVNGTAASYSNVVGTAFNFPIPATPTNLSVSPGAGTVANLTWIDNATNETGFEIQRQTSSNPNWVTVANVGANATSYTDSSISGGTSVNYRVRAKTAGSESPFSNVAGTAFLLLAPTTPTNLAVTPGPGLQANLAWNDTSVGETFYRIERQTNTDANWVIYATIPANSTSFIDTNITQGMAVNYRVQSIEGTQLSGYSNIAGTAFPVPPPAIPSAPTNLVVTPAAGPRANLTWMDTAGNETGFIVERQTSTNPQWLQVAVLGSNTMTYSDTNVSIGMAVNYRVRAVNGSLSSGYSNIAGTAFNVITVAAPTNLVVVQGTGPGLQANVSWIDNATNETAIRVERQTNTNANWVLVATLGANATTYVDTNVAVNMSVSYRVQAVSGSAVSGYSNIAGTSFSNATLAAPTNLSVTSGPGVQANLFWADNSTGETNFRIERQTGGTGVWNSIATVPANTTSYVDTNVTIGQVVNYRVQAYNATTASPYSVPAGTTITPTPVAAPSNLVVTAGPGLQANLTWVDNATNETAIRVERQTNTNANWVLVATLGANATAYTDTNITTGMSVNYRVQAVNTTAVSAYSNIAGTAFSSNTLNAPSNLAVTAGPGLQANLSWTDNSSVETAFRIERQTSTNGQWAVLATIAANSTTYVDTNLVAGISVNYRVQALTQTQQSAFSNIAGTTFVVTVAAPSNLVVNPAAGPQANLTWVDNASNETAVRVERQTSTNPQWVVIATLGANATSYVDTNVSIGMSANYRIQAVSGSTVSSYSNIAGTTFTLGNQGLAAPSNLAVTAGPGLQANVTWIDNAATETGIQVERQTSASPQWFLVATLGPNATSYTDTNVTTGIAFNYRVRAVNGGTASAFSNIAGTAFNSSTVAAPSNLVVTPGAGPRSNLVWVDNSTNETGFRIERQTNTSPQWTVLATVGANVTSYADTAVIAGIAVNYRVQALSGSLTSAYSNIAGTAFSASLASSASTFASTGGNINGISSGLTGAVPNAPSNLRGSVVSSRQVKLSWNDNSANDTGFILQRSLDNGTTWTTFASVDSTVTSIIDNTLVPEWSYLFRVMAKNGSGWSASSNVIQGSTLGFLV